LRCEGGSVGGNRSHGEGRVQSCLRRDLAEQV
jgi:hypothetical protein